MKPKDKKQLATRGSTAVAKKGDWRQQLAAQVRDESAKEQATIGNKISTKGGKFSFRGMPLPQPMRAIIVDFVYENRWYEGEYDEENPVPPDCYALGLKEDELQPAEVAPNHQSADCTTCELNQWGTGRKGEGKACKNRRRVAVISADVKELTSDYIETTEIAVLEISPTGLGGWRTLVNKVRDGLGLSEQMVITSFDTEQRGSTYFVTGSIDEEIDDRSVIKAIMARREEARTLLLQDYTYTPHSGERPKKKAPKPAKAGRGGGVLRRGAR